MIDTNVYIATYSQYDNYGSCLQNYALCCVVRKAGADPVTVCIRDIRYDMEIAVKYLLSFIPFCRKGRFWINDRKKSRVFKQFKKRNNIRKLSYRKLCGLAVEDSIAIAGSDQIWNPASIFRYPQNVKLYFLRFFPKQKRYAYAPSFGVKHIPAELAEDYRTYLNEFNLLSVREPEGRNIIKALTGKEVPVLPDPTFLLTRKEWDEVTGGIKRIFHFPYLVIYFLSRQSDAALEHIYKYAEKKGWSVVRIAGNEYVKGQIIPAPDEFVKIVGEARAVITDSFHGAAFSIILNTPFVVFRRTDVDQFSRVENLLNVYGLTDAYCAPGSMPDYDKVFSGESFETADAVISAEKERAEHYLDKILPSK